MDFDSTKHRSCPVCEFETLFVDGEITAYVHADNTLDYATSVWERDNTVHMPVIVCNRVGCDWHEDYMEVR